MRICSPQLRIAPDATLGGEVYDRETLKQMAALGAEIEILLPAGQTHPEVDGWRVSRLPLSKGYRWFVSNLVFVPYIGRLYRQRPFDILRVHSLRFTGLAALWARKLYRLPVPIVAHHHHIDFDRWSQRIDGHVVNLAGLTITGSQFSRAQLTAAFGVPTDKVAVTPYGVDEFYRPSGKKRENGLILHVGSLKARKNIPLLLEAFRSVLASLPEARLVLIGRGPDEAVLRRQAGEMGLAEAVTFAGFVSEEEKLAYYHRAELLVSASAMEGFGLAVAEAMACGLPVVVADAGSLAEVVLDGETGLVAPVNDPAAIAQGIMKLLADKPLAIQMGQSGVKRVEDNFRWPMTARRTLELYEGLL